MRAQQCRSSTNEKAGVENPDSRNLAQPCLSYNVSELINLQPGHSPAVPQHFSFPLGGF